MATRTTNYRLTKPEQTDLVDIDELNGNFDIIDTQMKANADAARGKQDVLTFDEAPTANSRNPVRSGGIYTALRSKQDALTFDEAPVSGSRNPARSGGIYTELGKKHRILFQSVDSKVRKHIIAGTKRRVLKEGVLLEKFTFDEWIRHIEGME